MNLVDLPMRLVIRALILLPLLFWGCVAPVPPTYFCAPLDGHRGIVCQPVTPAK